MICKKRFWLQDEQPAEIICDMQNLELNVKYFGVANPIVGHAIDAIVYTERVTYVMKSSIKLLFQQSHTTPRGVTSL